jgi:enoyl-CoA hydratase/carnithine racemase
VTKPIIAAMTGSLMAGGMMLALKADLRVGLRGTRAGITEVKMGRGTPWAVPMLWMLPQPLLMELVLTGETLPIERLAEHGFLNYLEDTPDKGACPRTQIGACDRGRRATIGEGRQGKRAGGDGFWLCERRDRAERLHVEICQPGCGGGAASVFRKTQAGVAGQIGFRLS